MSDPKWPREIWMAEREDHDQGVVHAVLSEHATISRWEGDTERDRDFHRYVDADIYDSSEKYHRVRYAAIEAENERLRAELADGSFYKESDIDALQDEIERLRRDCKIMLAQLDFMEEATGESLDPEDAVIVAQIRASLKGSNE